MMNPWARRLIFTHNSQHARLEIPMDLRDPIAFSPPRHETRARGARSKDVGKHEGITPRHSMHAIWLYASGN